MTRGVAEFALGRGDATGVFDDGFEKFGDCMLGDFNFELWISV